ncbi:MLO-like protein 12 [Corylus avellana]|uniref:MLO-like protein 12 n=1 Tax=Corylus avellana TaxID=13451 RepID=UPI00286D5E70|nr:MLO-like protein 12 [Corylus avellana]
MDKCEYDERTMAETPTWAVAVVCFMLLAISIFIEHIIEATGKWLKAKHKGPLHEALEKIKSEIMLLGFISLLLTVFQEPISGMCIPMSVGDTWHPCIGEKKYSDKSGRKVLQLFDSGFSGRRRLATKGCDKCKKGKVAFMSAYSIHQLHIFIFVLAVFHVLYCIITLALGTTKIKRWKAWEEETRTLESQGHIDHERFRFARETSFGRRHLTYWSKSTVSLWMVCFFRQFFRSITKVDYITLRYGFIVAHLAPGSETTFDFQKYIQRALEADFKFVVGISPKIWCFAVLSLLSNAYGWHSYLWLPFLPLIVILLVGTQLQVIITKMGLRIQERGDVIKGTPVVQPGDDLFWFGNPRFLLYLIHFVLFQNAFQLAFYAWSVYAFGINSCFHKRTEDKVIRLSTGIITQVLCSYVTLPLYALVIRMGSSMNSTIFNDGVATALKSWHRKAKKKSKHAHHSEANSPIHLLHNYQHRSLDSLHTSPNDHFEMEDLEFQRKQSGHEDSMHSEQEKEIQEQRSSQLPPSLGTIRTQHEINVSPSDFSFRR